MSERVSNQLIVNAVDKAKVAFWDAIAEEFPEAQGSDLHIEAVWLLDKAMMRAVKEWLAQAAPELFPESGE